MMSLAGCPEQIRLGITGLTEGNFHPYSWSAIVNGYDKSLMRKRCPVQTIPDYLDKEPDSSFGIPGVRFTHVHCDDAAHAEAVSQCSLVPNIAEAPGDMIGKVDAVVIATDIGSEHVRRARPFVEAGVPLFIDKPLCDNLEDLKIFRSWIESGKRILSSSSMRYCKEFQIYHGGPREFGDLKLIGVTMAKKWETYGIHALEAVYPILGPGFISAQNTGSYERNIVHLTHSRGVDVVIACGKGFPCGGVRISGTAGEIYVKCHDTFSSFKTQLLAFVSWLRTGEPPLPFSETDELMRMVIAGVLSRENSGQKIMLEDLK
jgi:hypothetical protein